jgi:4-hydroxy-tetrahydrodipicolinate reductase
MTEGLIRVAVTGAGGSMGRQVGSAVQEAADMTVAALVDPTFTDAAGDSTPPAFGDLESALENCAVDVLVDFTVAEAARANVAIAVAHRVATVVGTTGMSGTDLENLRREAESTGTPVFVAPNFAIGAVLMMLFAEQAARQMDFGEIVELHHERKLDAPSGTAMRTAELIQASWKNRGHGRQVPVHSVRLPGLVAHQEVIFGGTGQTLTIRHDSISRESFMPGVLLAVRRVRSLKGLTVGLENLL